MQRSICCSGKNAKYSSCKKSIRIRDSDGYITRETTKTNIPGVFVKQEMYVKHLRQIVTAASDGAVARKFAEEYIGYIQ